VTNEQSIEDLLARLERERLDADRLYNDALTAVDRALRSAPTLPGSPPRHDESRVADLNATWDILPDGPPPTDTSLKGRLRRFVWRLVGPSLETQKRFNAALVDHVNRNVAAARDSSQALASLIAAVDQELRALARFESLLVQYLQTVTVYVDSKDRSLGGKDIRERLALTEQRLLALKRDMEVARRPEAALVSQAESQTPFSGSVDSLTYVAFEDQFRGSQDDIRRRVEDYVPILATASDVVDIGCGRGELLALLKERGVTAHGVDVNPAMVALCRGRGLDVQEGDALSYLQRQVDASIGGLIGIQVVEHFAPAYLTKCLETAFHKMRPGAPLLLETINVACWTAFFETYLRDVTHRQPLHPDTLRHLVQASGFTDVDVQFRAPVAETDRLNRVRVLTGDSVAPGVSAPLEDLRSAINAHADKLNRLLFSSMDYVVVARR
jgi:O-antigen chain-terminating methyltransferase